MSLREPSRAGRSWFVPCCATSAALALLWAFPGCLNPVPDEFPSNRAPVVEPERETCEDNPYLAECEPPPAVSPDDNLDTGEPASPDPHDEDPNEGTVSNRFDAGAPDAGDAGADVEP